MPRNIFHYLKWFCTPKNITCLTGFCILTVLILFVGIMSAYFNNVTIDNCVLNENPMFKMITEANAFMEDVHANVSGHSGRTIRSVYGYNIGHRNTTRL